MISIILCEGADDAFILGAYFELKLSFSRNNNAKSRSKFQIPKTERNLNANIYIKGNFYVVIINVNGKDRFQKAVEYLSKAQEFPAEESISQLFLMADRDNTTEEEKLNEIYSIFLKFFPQNERTTTLRNNQPLAMTYPLRSQVCSVQCIPVVIPYNEEGALETILMNEIKESSPEGAFVVQQANKYIDLLLESGRLSEYLKHERDKLKARFSSTLSVTNPDHSISPYVTLLESFHCKSSPVIAENFRVFDEFFA